VKGGVHAGSHAFEDLLVLEDLVKAFDLIDDGFILADVQFLPLLPQEVAELLQLLIADWLFQLQEGGRFHEFIKPQDVEFLLLQLVTVFDDEEALVLVCSRP
jgi:hypothetical protein